MSKPTCFIIMPLTTPAHMVETYKGDTDHFRHVLDHLFIPAVEASGLEPRPPISKGSEVIHGDIIRNLETADLVLCDMSILNPNVFFELGIRTALNKSVAMVRDDATKSVPFDMAPVSYHVYNSLMAPWVLDDQIKALKTHISACLESDGNSLWTHFSMSQQAHVSDDAPELEKQVAYLIKQVENLAQRKVGKLPVSKEPKISLIDQVTTYLLAYGLDYTQYRLRYGNGFLILRTLKELEGRVYSDLEGFCLEYNLGFEYEVDATLGPVGPEAAKHLKHYSDEGP